jgi:hypothetical protein
MRRVRQVLLHQDHPEEPRADPQRREGVRLQGLRHDLRQTWVQLFSQYSLLHTEIDCDQTSMGLPPVKSAVFIFIFIYSSKSNISIFLFFCRVSYSAVLTKSAITRVFGQIELRPYS